MALPDLLRALREQAAERREQERSDAERIATRVREESRSALERRRADLLARTRREEEETAHRALSRARTESAVVELAARDRLLQRVRVALEERIAGAVRHEAYRSSLEADLSLGLARLPAGPVVVLTRPDLVEPVREALGAREGVEVRASDGVGVGFSASVEKEGVEVDGTLSARLEHAWPRLAVAVLRDAAS
jgi:vacuolar-type H+-ATPase subunit E/Vma4